MIRRWSVPRGMRTVLFGNSKFPELKLGCSSNKRHFFAPSHIHLENTGLVHVVSSAGETLISRNFPLASIAVSQGAFREGVSEFAGVGATLIHGFTTCGKHLFFAGTIAANEAGPA